MNDITRQTLVTLLKERGFALYVVPNSEGMYAARILREVL